MKSKTLLGTALLVLLAALLAPSALATQHQYTTTCLTSNGCLPSYSKSACLELESKSVGEVEGLDEYPDVDQLPKWYPVGETPGDLCEEVCCDANGIAAQMSKISCLSGYGEDAVGGEACGEEDPTRLCEDGQTDCVCEGVQISGEQWCCGGTITDSPDCGEQQTTTPGPASCGDGTRQSYEQCDYTLYQETGDVGTCEDTEQQACTINCRCRIDDQTSDPTDDVCEPNEPCNEADLCSTDTPTPNAAVDPVTGELKMTVSWGFSDTTCAGEREGYVIEYRRQEDGAGPVGLSVDNTTTKTNITDLTPETTYELTVTAIYQSGDRKESDPVEFETGDEECFGELRSFCEETEDGSTAVTCDAANKAQREQCGERVCYPTTDGAQCLERVDCDECNRGYASFGEVNGDETVGINFGDQTVHRKCELLTSVSVPDQDRSVSFCYLDYSQSALKEYKSCASANSCSDYTSSQSCGDDPCTVRGSCTWNSTYSLCTAQEAEFQTCDAETAEECEAQGACVYYGECRSKSEMTCKDYDTQTECVGETGSFDLNHTTNVPTTESSDVEGFGKCKWVSDEIGCYKDADDDYGTDGGELEDDADFTSPETTLLAPTTGTSPATITTEYPSTVVIPFVASEDGKTYMELVQGACGEPERPTKQVTDNLTETDLETGTYCLNYYTRDNNQNVEPVRQAQVSVNADQLEITDAGYEVEPWPQRQTADVRVHFNTSREATCNAELSGPEGAIPPSITDAKSTAFAATYKDLPDETYQYDITCELRNGATAEHNFTITLDTNTRITDPRPQLGTYRSDSLVTIAVHTRGDAQCRYRDDGEWHAFDNKAPANTTYTKHTAPVPDDETGFHTHPVECTFPDGLVMSGGPADTIKYAIDDAPPATNITTPDGKRAGSDVIVGADGTQLNITCTDEEIPARHQDWSAGCEQTVLDAGEGADTYQTPFTYVLEDGTTIEVYSTDALGNEEAPHQTLTGTDKDISGPERPDFEVIE